MDEISFKIIQSDATEVEPHFKLPGNDFMQYLTGAWKRNLEWREFGPSYRIFRTSNTLLLVSQEPCNEAGTKCLRWNFSKSLDPNDIKFSYDIKFRSISGSKNLQLEWDFGGITCKGRFIHSANVASLDFILPTSTVLATYRVIDQDTMAVCIIELGDNETPNIQYGNMYRIDISLYKP